MTNTDEKTETIPETSATEEQPTQTEAQEEQTEEHLFIAKLALPIQRTMATIALGSVQQIAAMLELDEQISNDISLATEEAFLNVVDHFSGPITTEERVYLEFTIEGPDLVISIRERGIPFLFDEAKTYSSDSLEDMEKPGLGTLLITSAMDKVEYFVHGREGKETRMRKKLPAGLDLPRLPPKSKSESRSKLDDIVIRPPTEEELPALTQLAWRCYGYSQVPFLYDHEALKEKIDEGAFQSLIAIDESSGTLVGHCGLKFDTPNPLVPEIGAIFLDPTFRLPKVCTDMCIRLMEISKGNGLLGALGNAVTTHALSQRMAHQNGSRPCALLFGLAIEGLNARELATTTQEKGSLVQYYFGLDHSSRKIYVPPRHLEVVKKIYETLELPREFAEPPSAEPTGESKCTHEYKEEGNSSFIILRGIGQSSFSEVAEHLRNCRRERIDAVYAFLALNDPGTPWLTEQCERIGFSFAGITPHILEGEDCLLLQCIDAPIDMEKIRTYGDLVRNLFNYARSEKERVEKNP